MYPLLPKNVSYFLQICTLLSLSHCLYTYGPYISGEVVCVVILSISISKEEEKCVIHTCSYVSDVLLEMQSKVCVRKQSFANSTQ